MNSCFVYIYFFTFNKFRLLACVQLSTIPHTNGSFRFHHGLFHVSINIAFCQFESKRIFHSNSITRLLAALFLVFVFLSLDCVFKHSVDTYSVYVFFFFCSFFSALSQYTCPAISQITVPFMFNICSYM